MNEPTPKPSEHRQEPKAKSSEARHEEPKAEDEGEQGAPRPSWYARLKQRIEAKRNALLDGGIAFLERRKHGSKSAVDPLLDKPRGKASSAEPAPVAAAEPPKHGRRNLLIVLMLLVATTVGGMSLSYQLLSRLLDEQSAKIRLQQEQITSLNEEDKNKAAQTAELMKKVDDDQTKLTAAEERNVAFEARVMELESRTGEPLMPQPGLPFTRQAVAKPKSVQPSKASTFTPGGRTTTADCNLKPGTYGDNLKRCIEDFNRN